jgi:hypothetical protein
VRRQLYKVKSLTRRDRPAAVSRRRRGAALVALLAGAILLLTAAAASAVIVSVRGTALSYDPAPNGASGKGKAATPAAAKAAATALEYHGGPVMASNTNYTLYWDPPGAPAYPAGYETGLNRYFEDLAHDSGGNQNTDSVLTQYKDAAGEYANYSSFFGGGLIDTDAYPANGCSSAPICLTDGQLRSEISKYVAERKLPTDLRHEYFLLTPPGVESCFEALGHACSVGAKHATYCSYHSYLAVSGGVIVYANDPYIDGSGCDPGEEHPNNNASDATIGGGLAHEHSESVTDPELDAWKDSKGNEVADKCATGKEATEFGPALGRAPDGAKYNQVIDSDLYWYQQMWSNEAGGCVQRLAAAQQTPTVTKLAPKKGPSAGGTSVTVTGTGFTGVATVKFGATSATSFKVDSTTSLTAVSPSAPDGAVDVTVITTAGTSPAGKKDIFKYRK